MKQLSFFFLQKINLLPFLLDQANEKVATTTRKNMHSPTVMPTARFGDASKVREYIM